MLFTWDTTDLCIVFHDWHVTGTGSLVVSLLAIVLMTAGYEAVREASRRYEAHAAKLLEGRRGGDDLRGKFRHLISEGQKVDVEPKCWIVSRPMRTTLLIDVRRLGMQSLDRRRTIKSLIVIFSTS
jgi:hypothetical protein